MISTLNQILNTRRNVGLVRSESALTSQEFAFIGARIESALYYRTNVASVVERDLVDGAILVLFLARDTKLSQARQKLDELEIIFDQARFKKEGFRCLPLVKHLLK